LGQTDTEPVFPSEQHHRENIGHRTNLDA